RWRTTRAPARRKARTTRCRATKCRATRWTTSSMQSDGAPRMRVRGCLASRIRRMTMKLKRYAAWLPAVFLLCAAVPARADLMETVPFNLGVGPSQKTIELPQFNPALGTLTETFLLVNGSIQYVVDVFNNGAGPFSATVED